MKDRKLPSTSQILIAQAPAAKGIVSRRHRAWRRLLRDKLGMVSLAVSLLILLLTSIGSWVAPQDPYAIAPVNRLKSPSMAHLLGTDEMGRDVFSRVIWGTRISVGVSLAVTLGGMVLGILIGTIASLGGRLADEITMRITDIFLAVPLFILAMAITAALGPSMTNAALAMVLVWWPGYARQTRGQVLATKNALYVEAAHSVGASQFRLTVSHILPNCLAPVFVRASTTTGYVILTTAGLSFIGLGSQPPTADWGTMVAVARNFLLSAPWYPIVVGLPMFITVLAFALAGDAIQNALEMRGGDG